MAKKNFLERLQQYYQGDGDALGVNDLKRKQRIDYIMRLKIDDIAISDKRIILAVKKDFNLNNYFTILNDITIAERILASGKSKRIDSDKYWIRYFISETLKEAIRIARDKGDAYAMIQASNTIGKHHLTDKEDELFVAYNEIVPFIPEITNDISVLGIKPIKDINKLKEKLLKKYDKESETIDYEEI